MASEQVTRSPPAQWSGLSNPAAGKLFLFFIFPFFFFVFSFPFRRSPLFASFSFSLCRFPFVVRIAFVASIFASLLSLVADSVCLSQCYAPPPRDAWEPASQFIPLYVVLVLMFFISCIFCCSLPPLFWFCFGRRCFILFVFGGHCAFSSVLVATRSPYDTYLIPT